MRRISTHYGGYDSADNCKGGGISLNEGWSRSRMKDFQQIQPIRRDVIPFLERGITKAVWHREKEKCSMYVDGRRAVFKEIFLIVFDCLR